MEVKIKRITLACGLILVLMASLLVGCVGKPSCVDELKPEQIINKAYAAPDHFYAKTTDGGWTEFILIGIKLYARSSDSEEWQVEEVPMSARGHGIEILGEGRLDYLLFLVDLEKLPSEEIDGIDCLHYRGKVNVDTLTEKDKAAVGLGGKASLGSHC
jgi:hypothetical protein